MTVNGLALGSTKFHSGSVRNIQIFRENLEWHEDNLKTKDGKHSLQDLFLESNESSSV